MRWSVSLVTEGDREVVIDEVVALADAVAGHQGIATGIGTYSYGVQVVVDAGTPDESIEIAKGILYGAVASAGLPVWPIVDIETVGEEEDMDWYEEIPEGRGL